MDQWEQVTNHARWEPTRTAAVICDMWDRHWCKSATARVAEMAPRMNEVITELRHRGVLIIHCPSDTMSYYEGTPGRKLAQAAPHVETAVPLKGWANLDPDKEGPLPIDDADGGCPDEPPCAPATKAPWPWQHEIDALQIKQGDAITDSAEAFYLMRQRGITNMIIMGVHENMCILARPFGIRQMVGQGQNVVLMRDLTDTMYNPRQMPYVNHFTGTDIMTWHIEKYWCPTITSDQITRRFALPFRRRHQSAGFSLSQLRQIAHHGRALPARQALHRGHAQSGLQPGSRLVPRRVPANEIRRAHPLGSLCHARTTAVTPPGLSSERTPAILS